MIGYFILFHFVFRDLTLFFFFHYLRSSFVRVRHGRCLHGVGGRVHRENLLHHNIVFLMRLCQ
jgi:hypothetical protein